MSRCAVLCGFAALVLVAGVLAGDRVHTALAKSEPGLVQRLNADPDPAPLEFKLSRFRDHVLADERAEPFARLRHSDGSAARDATFVSASKDARMPSDDESHALPFDTNVLLLVQKAFPDADPETSKIWAESFSGMDPSEVEFILEQKRLLSGSLDVVLAAHPEMNISISRSASVSDEPTSLQQAVRQVSHNLSGEWSVGFRRTVLLPESGCVLSAHADPQPVQFRSLMFRSFEPGKLIPSPQSLHVALPADDGSLMFRLENDRLTRRGDFQILPDRRVGLITHAGSVALIDSESIPDNARDFAISRSGAIEYTDTAGMTVTAGWATVTRVNDLSALSSDDGVIFVTHSSESLSKPAPATITLATGTLELSNVDRENERALLEHLQSLRADASYHNAIR